MEVYLYEMSLPRRAIFPGLLVRLCGCLCAALVIASCGPMHKMGYVTQTHNMPLMSQTFDGHVMGALGFNHLELQSAFSPIRHVALMGNYYQGNQRSSQMALQWGAGLYHAFNDRLIVEAFYLTDEASIYNRKNRIINVLLSEHVDYRSEELFSEYGGNSVQLDIGYIWNGEYEDETTFTAGLGVKFSTVNFDKFYYRYKLYGDWALSTQYVKEEYEVTLPRPDLKFMAISGTFKYGTGGLRGLFQYSHHIGLNGFGPSQDEPPYYQPAWLSIGIEAYIPNKKRHRK